MGMVNLKESFVKLFEKMSLEPRMFNCNGFMDESGREGKVAIIVVPFKFQPIKNDVLIVGWSCSRGDFCMNQSCRYSFAGRRKVEVEDKFK